MTETGNKQWIFVSVFLLSGFLFLLKLTSLQILDDDYKGYAHSNAIRRVVQYAPRGYILDRNYELLVYNEVSYDLMVTPKECGDLDTVEFCRLADLSKEDFVKSMNTIQKMVKEKKLSKSQPTPLVKQMSKEAVAGLEEKMYKYEGFYLQPRILRKYPKAVGAGILGYIGEVDDAKVKENPYYRPGDYVGKSGLEKSYESVLRGVKGVKNLFVDNLNNPRGSYMDGAYDTAATPGLNLVSTLDIRIQEYGEQLMQNKKGSIVAIEPATGEILCMVSSPTYDPNLLVGRGIKKNYPDLVLDPNLPLYNRAIQAVYPPGSTFKPVTALVALDEGVISPSFGFPCGGAYNLCGRPIRCTHAGGGHAANLRAAMANSCNAYFSHLYRLSIDAKRWGSVKYGQQRWKEYMNAFGLGHPVGIDIPNEKGGNMPDSAYYNRMYRGSWNSCTSVFLGMGQGELLMTPLQMANMMALIANKGYYCIPHLVKSIGNDQEHPLLDKYRRKLKVANIPDSAFNSVILGLMDVVDRGTGRVAKMEGIEVCAKTGTAENYRVVNGVRVKLQNHSMFVAFAPRENPKIAIAVAVENAGYGATWAGPIASLIMEKYLTGEVKRPELEKRMFEGNLMELKIIPDKPN